MKKTYQIINAQDGNDTFEVEANSIEKAAFVALGLLGWGVSVSETNEEENE